MSAATFRPGDRFRVADRGDEHDGSTGVVRSTFITSDGEEFAHVLHDDGSITMWETSRLEPIEPEPTPTFAPGTRVRRTDNGRTGTVDYTAVETDSLAEYPGMVPVAWDGDDAWLASPHVLDVIDVLPAASEPQEPKKAANDGGINERSTTMSTITISRESAREWLIRRMREAISENSSTIRGEAISENSSTIRGAALAMGMAPVTLSRRLNGRSGKSFTITEICALADHLGIDWLSFFPDEMLVRDTPKVVSLQDPR